MMIPGERPPPNDQRDFIHKKLLRGISSVAGILPVPGAGLVSRVTGALGGRPSQETAAEGLVCEALVYVQGGDRAP